MKSSPFHRHLEDLPGVLPVFPLSGVILLPRAQLPLNIFEPRYLAMTLDALGAGRLIGMLQPDPARHGSGALARVGCAGRITAFSETDDGRLLIVLTGVCRFEAGDELELLHGYRRVLPSWRPYAADLEQPDPSGLRAPEILTAVGRYAEEKALEIDLEGLAKLPAEGLVNALAMNLPFRPDEKQALLEARNPVARADLLLAFMRFAESPPGSPAETWH